MQPPHVHKNAFYEDKKGKFLGRILFDNKIHSELLYRPFPLISHHDNNKIYSYLGKTWSYLRPFQSYLGQIIGAIFQLIGP